MGAFSRFFIERPIFATVIAILITLAGVMASFSLPIAQYPEISPPVHHDGLRAPAPTRSRRQSRRSEQPRAPRA